METPVCQLCNKKVANQTGSHIFSWFLIRECINKSGVKRRHNEITFGISPKTFVETYIGSEIQPEEILKIKGRDLTEAEIEDLKTSNPFTKDHILCSECEKELSVLETAVEQRIFAKYRKHNLKTVLPYEVIEEKEGNLLRLFIYSLAWRAAIVNQNDFRMGDVHKEALRGILDDNLSLNIQELDSNLLKNHNVINQYPLIVTISEVIGNNDNYVYCAHSSIPYSMILNDLSFQLFFKEKQIFSHEDLQGINRVISKKNILNIKEDRFKIGIISNEKRIWVNHNLAHYISDKMMRMGVSYFREIFKTAFRKPAPEGLVAYFKFQVAFNSNNQVENYTISHFINVTVRVMEEYTRSLGFRVTAD